MRDQNYNLEEEKKGRPTSFTIPIWRKRNKKLFSKYKYFYVFICIKNIYIFYMLFCTSHIIKQNERNKIN